jgi:7,8-dihydropterin-6-yl-methyl-4-(beta-D-ribofuranosyl)aminobenzene 5'-phosphate synthase
VLYAAELAVSRRIPAFIDGVHMLTASEQRLRATTQAFKDFEVRPITPCHCTGFAAAGLSQAELGPAVIELRAGSNLRLPEAA